MADPTTLLVGRAVGGGFPPGNAARFFELEYRSTGRDAFARLAASRRAISCLSKSTKGDLAASTRWREVFGPLGLGDELRASLRTRSTCWGYLALHRERSSRAFNDDEVRRVLQIAGILADGLRRGVLHGRRGRSIDDAPATLIVRPDRTIESMTTGARARLDDVLNSTPTLAHDLPDPVHAVVSTLFAASEELVPESPSVHVLGRSGEWCVVRAARLENGGGGPRAVVTIEPARASALMPVICQAYELTRAETAVTQLVISGLSTSEIACRATISANTVQDHVQAIYKKVGARSRVDLVNAVYATFDTSNREDRWPDFGQRPV